MTAKAGAVSSDVVPEAEEVLEYYDDAIAEAARTGAPSVTIQYDDIYRSKPHIAERLLNDPEPVLQAFTEALREYPLPVAPEVEDNLSTMIVRVAGLPDEATHYPGEFSPTTLAGEMIGVEGEIAKITDTYSVIREAAFRCQRCETLTRVPQSDDTLQEPAECRGCERQGPFRIDHSQSTHEDVQQARVQTPPDHAQAAGTAIDVYLRGELTDQITVGDEVIINGQVDLEQQAQKNRFDPVVRASSIEIQESTAEEIDVTPAEKDRIESIANGEEGDPLEIAAASYAPKIHGHDEVKMALVLALVGGTRVTYESDDADRGEFHVLLIGDPSTAKSKLIKRAETVGWRSIGISGKGARQAGVTAAAVQDDFGDGNSWSLEAGALVKANGGVVAIDELDDMDPDARSSLLEPMSDQRINVNKAGINATLETRCAVVAAANPSYGRFDQYEPIVEQFDFDAPLLQRFDLIFTFTDTPDPERDDEIAEHILHARDAAKGGAASDASVTDTPIDDELLRKWVAIAKQQPAPTFADASVRESLKDGFTTLRSMRQDDEVVPVTFRHLEGTVRIAEAAARLELSDEITERHVSIAQRLAGASLQDIGKDPETNEFDADVVETGMSNTQRQRIGTIESLIDELQSEYDGSGVPIDALADRAAEAADIPPEKTEAAVKKLKRKGEAYEPADGHVRLT